MQSVLELSQAFALAVPHVEALRIRDDVAFFQAVRSVLAKRAPADARPEEELDHAVRQIISRAVSSEGVIDIFAAAGLEKPDLSILSDEFLAEVRGMPQRNLAVELLQKLLKGELVIRRRKNVVQARSFAETAGADSPALSEPRHRSGAGDRGIDLTCKRYAGGCRTRGGVGAVGRRTGVLRRAGNQRQRGASAG